MTNHTDAAKRRTTAGLVLGTAAWNVVQNVALPRWTYVWVNAAGGVGALALGRRLGLGTEELGSSRRRLRRGLVIGAAAGTAVALGLAGLWMVSREPFRDARAQGLSALGVLYEAGVRIPLGTAFFEEILFRGLLLAWLAKQYGTRRGLLWSSALFGLWHVLPTWEATALYQGGSLRTAGGWQAPAGVLGGAVATGAVGAAFGVLRLRSGSLAAPVVVHAVANSGAFIIAWLVQR
jgi:membrane protease YdiL (CAAX protease family)